MSNATKKTLVGSSLPGDDNPVDVTCTIYDLKTKAVVDQWVETMPNNRYSPKMPDGWAKAHDPGDPLEFVSRPTEFATHKFTMGWPPQHEGCLGSEAVLYVGRVN